MVHIDPILRTLPAFLLIIGMIGAPSAASNILIQSGRAKDKAKANQLVKAAEQLWEKEHCRPDDITLKCRDAFKKAADAYEQFIEDYLRQDRKDQAYADAVFELAGLREKESNDQEAKRQYLNCLRLAEEYHGEPFAKRIRPRLQKVEHRLNRNDRQDRWNERFIDSRG